MGQVFWSLIAFGASSTLWALPWDAVPLCSHRPYECTTEPDWRTCCRSSWNRHAFSGPRTAPGRDGRPWHHGAANVSLWAATPRHLRDGAPRHDCRVYGSSTEWVPGFSENLPHSLVATRILFLCLRWCREEPERSSKEFCFFIFLSLLVWGREALNLLWATRRVRWHWAPPFTPRWEWRTLKEVGVAWGHIQGLVFCSRNRQLRLRVVLGPQRSAVNARLPRSQELSLLVLPLPSLRFSAGHSPVFSA